MSQSFVRQVDGQETRFVGSTPIYDSGVASIVTPNPYIFDINISTQVPLPELSRIHLTVSGQPDSDPNGTIYSGQFRIRRNASTGSPSISVSGSNLTANQLTVIRNAMSVVENVSSSGLDSLTDLTLSLTPIANAGARFFDITIPYDDDNITLPDTQVVIPFLSFDASNRGPSYINPIIVSVDNNELTIDAGPIERESPVITFEANYASTRNITLLQVSFAGITVDDHLTLAINENLATPVRQEAFRLIANNVASLPSSDSDGFTTSANYNVRTVANFWQTNVLSGSFLTVHRDTASGDTGRLSYSIKYGIGKVSGADIVPETMFSFGVYATSSASFLISGFSLVVTIDDTGASDTTRRPFTITNRHSDPFTRFYLNIDQTDESNNSLIIQGYINAVPTTLSYSGFSNSMTVSEFVDAIQEILRTQYPLWYNDTSSPVRGLVFTEDARYAYGSVRDLSNVDVTTPVNPGQSLSNTFYLLPSERGAVSYHEITFYNPALSISMSFQEIFDWMQSELGSYGLYFVWNVPNRTEWRDLKFYPVVYAGSSLASQTIYSSGQLIPWSFLSRTDCFFSITKDSSRGQEINYSVSPPVGQSNDAANAIVISGSGRTVATTASQIESRLSTIINNNYSSKIGDPPQISISCSVTNDYYANLDFSSIYRTAAQTFSSLSGYPIFRFPSSSGGYSRYQTPLATNNTIGNTLAGSFAKVGLTGVTSTSLQIPINALNGLGELVDYVNSSTTEERFDRLIRARLVDDSYSALPQQDITPINFWDIKSQGTLYINSSVDTPVIYRYSFSVYNTLASLVNQINTDWLTNIDVQIDPATSQHSDTTPSRLVSGVFADITRDPLPKFFDGSVSVVPTPPTPTANVTLRVNVAFATDDGGNNTQSSTFGVQVALGGYEKNGVFYVNNAPNAFYEPVYNSIFPISFTTIDADVVYLLIRTRTELDNPTYTSQASHYSGLVRYSNGYTPYSLTPYVPTESRFTNAWDEGGTLGIPAVVAIPVYATSMDITIEDNFIFDAINLNVINRPSEINEFGFLAINRTNNTRSQKVSKVGATFGLVLDNRGAWDVLISPESILTESNSGSIAHLGSLYSREVLDDDEGFEIALTTSLPSAIQDSVSLRPVANNPQVWVLRIEHGVKKYLSDLRAANSDAESLDGCSINLDFLVTGRTTGVQGTARVTIYHDYTCVYDIGLCDFFWNLIDPPKPAGPEIIQNRLDVSYQTLVDCNNLTTQFNNNLAVNAPMLLSVNNIPTFKNGNALLLIKSVYTPEIQGFYYPTGNEMDSMQFSDCSNISLNLPLIQRLNKEFLLLPGEDNLINDVAEIRSLLLTENSYLWVKPQFQFPPDDDIKDCDNNEIVVVGIGYVFKNWKNGLRQDDILIGANLLFPEGVFASPEINFCYRYYYNQKET